MPLFSNGICIRFMRKAYQKWYLWNKFRAVILIKFCRFVIHCTTQFIQKNYRLICYQSRTTNTKWMWILSEFKARDIVWYFFFKSFYVRIDTHSRQLHWIKTFFYNYVFMIINAIEKVSNFFPNHSYSRYEMSNKIEFVSTRNCSRI